MTTIPLHVTRRDTAKRDRIYMLAGSIIIAAYCALPLIMYVIGH